MIIGICGASSTGKSTLLNALMAIPEVADRIKPFRHVNARAILDSMGCRSMDLMNLTQLQTFQREYLRSKIKNEEGLRSFCSDRTFVDVAAYWLCRDAVDIAGSPNDDVLPICKTMAQRYSLHVFAPFGLIPFERDGYRSERDDFHKLISNSIKQLLIEWQLPWIELKTADLNERVKLVIEALR